MEFIFEKIIAVGASSDAVEPLLAELGTAASDSTRDQNYFRWKVTVAFRRAFEKHLDGLSPGSTVLEAFLALAVQLVGREVAHPSLPLQLFADIFNAKPLSECKKYWALLEERQEQLVPAAQLRSEQNARSQLLLLELSNALLARTSKVMDTTFAGNIQLLLARLLPLEHKSGLNLGGNFHSENVTAFEESTPDDEAAFGATRDLLVGASAAAVENSPPLDYSTYQNFWQVQKSLANPKSVLMSQSAWDQFRKQVDGAIGLFDTHRAEKGKGTTRDTGSGSSGSSSSKSGAPAKDSRGRHKDDDAPGGTSVGSTDVEKGGFGVKYLTKKSLLMLQLRDPQVQRQVLLQILIVAEYIGRYFSKVRGNKIKDPKTDLRDVVRRAESVLKQLPSGRKFLKFVRAMLAREQFWTEWKMKKCPPLQVGENTLPKNFTAKDGLLRPVSEYKADELFNGSSTLPDGNPLDLCRRAATAAAPPLDTILKRVRDANDPDNCIEDEFHPRRNAIYCWRGMRSLLAQHLSLFDTHFQHLEDAVWQLDNPEGKKEEAPSVLHKAWLEEEARKEAELEAKAKAEKEKEKEEEEKAAAAAAAAEKEKADREAEAAKSAATESEPAAGGDAEEAEAESESAPPPADSAEQTSEQVVDTKEETSSKRKASDIDEVPQDTDATSEDKNELPARKKPSRSSHD